MIEYITGRLHYTKEPQKRRVIAFVYCGPDAVKKVREICGPTNPHVARDRAPGTIRTLGTVVPVKDAAGKVVGERMDNLVHASASDPEAEREIKLWFKPNDMMPYMHAYETEVSEGHYYFKEEKLFTTHEPGSTCLLAPGDTAWRSDLGALRLILQGQGAPCPLAAVAAKYLINGKREAD